MRNHGRRRHSGLHTNKEKKSAMLGDDGARRKATHADFLFRGLAGLSHRIVASANDIRK